MLDTTTGEVVEKTLKHETSEVREFYFTLTHPVRVGIEDWFGEWFTTWSVIGAGDGVGDGCVPGRSHTVR
jgi:hypothetical protein